MTAYLIRRLFYAILILIGVNLITFWLFFKVNTPDDVARLQLGAKRVTPDAIAKWKAERGYDKPLLYNGAAEGSRTVGARKEGRLRACASAARGSRDADWGTHESLHHRILLEARRPPRGWRDDRSARSERSGRVGAGDVARLGPVAFGAVRNGLRGHHSLLATSASVDLLVASTTKCEQVCGGGE